MTILHPTEAKQGHLAKTDALFFPYTATPIHNKFDQPRINAKSEANNFRIFLSVYLNTFEAWY